MPPRQSPPGRGGKARRVHFCYTSTDANEQWHAYTAGPCQWYECHVTGKTKPCLREVTGGELVCPMCESVKPTEQTGFLPLYRELDGKPVFVIVHEDVRETVDKHRLHARVLVGRGNDVTDGVYVIKPLKAGAPYHSTLADRQKGADIWPTLVRIWNIPALTAWHERQTGIPDGGVLHPPAPERTAPHIPHKPERPSSAIEEKPCAELFGGVVRFIRERAERADDQTSLDPPAAQSNGE